METDPYDVTPDHDGGVLKVVKRPGLDADCKPWCGDRVHVHYTGTLENGTKFDSSRDRSERFSFYLGKGEVIKGWDLGVSTMCKGELAVFTIRSDYGYGETGSPPKIPGGATLTFEVELFDFEGEDLTKDKDKGVVKRIQESGKGFDRPNDGGVVTVSFTGRIQDGEKKLFDSRDEFTFVLGEGEESDIPKGLEIALEKMKKSEKAHITLSPSYGFGHQGHKRLGVPCNATLAYEIHLTSFERAKESWQLDQEQKLEQARLIKDKGTKFFKDGKLEVATNKYRKILEMLEHEESMKGEKNEERRNLLRAGRLNLAICCLKKCEWIEARNLCDKVIDDDPKVAKAYFRRGEALVNLNEHELAMLDFEKVLTLEPDNKAAKNKVIMCQHQIKAYHDKEKKTFANMFDRFAQADRRREDQAKKRQKPLEINKWENGAEGHGENSTDFLPVQGDVQMNLDLDKELKSREEAVPSM